MTVDELETQGLTADHFRKETDDKFTKLQQEGKILHDRSHPQPS